MSAFHSYLRFEDDGGFPFRLLSPLVYDSTYLDHMVVVPEGFKTDLCSIPRVLQNILPPVGRWDGAAVVHDFLYRQGGVTRAEADAVMLEAMQLSGVTWWQRWTVYLGLRLGGWVVWRGYRKKESKT